MSHCSSRSSSVGARDGAWDDACRRSGRRIRLRSPEGASWSLVSTSSPWSIVALSTALGPLAVESSPPLSTALAADRSAMALTTARVSTALWEEAKPAASASSTSAGVGARRPGLGCIARAVNSLRTLEATLLLSTALICPFPEVVARSPAAALACASPMAPAAAASTSKGAQSAPVATQQRPSKAVHVAVSHSMAYASRLSRSRSGEACSTSLESLESPALWAARTSHSIRAKMLVKMLSAAPSRGGGTDASRSAVVEKQLWRLQKPLRAHALSSPQSQHPPLGCREM